MGTVYDGTSSFPLTSSTIGGENSFLSVSMFSVSGQYLSPDQSSVKFCAQSLSKVINYCIAQELLGEANVHTYIGREPSGRELSELCLDHNNRPHNPYINAGAIMCTALINPHETMSNRFGLILDYWRKLTCSPVSYNVPAYLLEKEHADRNYCLAYMMKDARSFPPSIQTHRDLESLLDLYFLSCSISLTTAQGALMAATLANGGRNPASGEEVFSPHSVRNALSMMATSGMYNYSGEFAFRIGLPAKSSSGGALIICVPNIAGICSYSPRADKLGNSPKGLRFCELMCEIFSFHVYDIFDHKKLDARQRYGSQDAKTVLFLQSAKMGDYFTLQNLILTGTSPLVSNSEGRTALHLAARYGHVSSIFLIIRATVLHVRTKWQQRTTNKNILKWSFGVMTNSIENDPDTHDFADLILNLNPLDAWGVSVLDEASNCKNTLAGGIIRAAINLANVGDWDKLDMLESLLRTKGLPSLGVIANKSM